MKMGTIPNDIDIPTWYDDITWFQTIDPFRLSEDEELHESYFVATFDRDRLSEFVNFDQEDKFFTASQRGRLVDYFLKKIPYDGKGEESTKVGTYNLIHDEVLLDAYPLHDGPLMKRGVRRPTNKRQKLQKNWASLSCLFKYQPLEDVREYFGERHALYFAWLAFYTTFLVPAAVVGICCFIYGVVTAETSPKVLEACTNSRTKNGSYSFYMCPLCDKRCSYFLLSTNCLYSKVTNWFDNESTIFFAIFMSLWSTLYLEFWKRYQVDISYRWHSLGFKSAAEPDRPEFTASNLKLKKDHVTGKMVQYTPKGTKIRRILGSVSIVLFFIFLVLVCIVGVIVFRAALSVALIASDNRIVRERSKVIVSCAAGLLNLVAINLLRYIYNKVAVVLTNWENPRTRTQFEDSFTIKVFLFQFFNTYSSVIYVAFLKGEAVSGSPGRYRRFGQTQFRLDGCAYQGCFLELTIQLIIIMVGQQFINNIVETALPTFWKWRTEAKQREKVIMRGEGHAQQSQWVQDYGCEMNTDFTLFWQYCEIVLQYGFVVMFVAAFPLAPLFALMNNVVEIRVDAYNFVFNRRRPIAEMAEDIGAWYGILKTLTTVSVLINAFVLAFTSDLIPSFVYKYLYSQDGTLKGFVEWSLSSFNVKDYTNHSKPFNPTYAGIPEQAQCRYPGYRNPYHPYKHTIVYWEVLSIRLAFVLCFVVGIGFFEWMFSALVPDVPRSLELKIKREEYLASMADNKHKTDQRNMLSKNPSWVTANSVIKSASELRYRNSRGKENVGVEVIENCVQNSIEC